jgi:hypothetical protein
MHKRIILKSLIALALGAVPLLVFAQGVVNISSGLPGMTNVSTTGPCGWVSGFYNFALFASGILAFGAIVYGGVLYAISAGNASKQSEGRSWIWSALIGLLLLAGAYIILNTVNPGLVNCSLPSLSQINSGSGIAPLGGGGTSNTNPSAGGTCSPAPSGPCSVSQLQSTCLGSNAQAASQICMAESSGNAVNGGDISTNGQPVSIGLFQINLSANALPGLNCPSAFDHSWHVGSPSTITNPALYAQCVAAAQNVATNIAEACALSKNGTSWKAWSTATSCGLQ